MNDIVFIDKGELKTNSLIVANEYKRRHDNVRQAIKSLITTGHLGALEFKESYYTNLQGKRQPMYELSERGFLIAMPFIGGTKSRDGQVKLVDAFFEQRTLLNDHHTQLQKELQDFALQCRYSEERGSLAGKALRQRRTDIQELTTRKIELEAKYQYQLSFGG